LLLKPKPPSGGLPVIPVLMRLERINTVICPKCKKPLKLIRSKNGDYYTHTYSLSQIMGNGKICDYNIKKEIK